MSTFDPARVLKYLSLPSDYSPSPDKEPIMFLKHHLHQLPRELLEPFSSKTTPRERTALVRVRNRRTVYLTSKNGVARLSWSEARKNNPIAYESYMISATGFSGMPLASDPSEKRELRKGEQEGIDERDWAETHFLGGANEFRRHVGQGKLGSLLAQFEEERESENIRELRRQERERQRQEEEALEEEEESDTESQDGQQHQKPPLETNEEARSSFERLTHERFVDGVLEWFDYDEVDYDDELDLNGQDDEDRWFDEEDES